MNTEFEKVFRDAYDALIGKNKDVYPCREDVPAELWGKPIVQKTINAEDKNINTEK